jgi:hypothetical protein
MKLFFEKLSKSKKSKHPLTITDALGSSLELAAPVSMPSVPATAATASIQTIQATTVTVSVQLRSSHW